MNIQEQKYIIVYDKGMADAEAIIFVKKVLLVHFVEVVKTGGQKYFSTVTLRPPSFLPPSPTYSLFLPLCNL